MRRPAALLGLATLATALGGCGTSAVVPSVTTPSPPVSSTTPQPRRAPAAKHVILVVLENQEATAVLKSVHSGIFRSLEERYATLTRYHAVAHPSLPNYLALLAGSTLGMARNCLDCVFTSPSLPDTLAAAGETWKEYVEGLPRNPGDIDTMGIKVRIPFLYFRTVTSRPAEMANVVPLTRLQDDLRGRTLPSFSIVVPNLCHAMHDCGIASGDAWLAAVEKRAERSVVMPVPCMTCCARCVLGPWRPMGRLVKWARLSTTPMPQWKSLLHCPSAPCLDWTPCW